MTNTVDPTPNGRMMWKTAHGYAAEHGLPDTDQWLVELDQTARRIAAEFGLSPRGGTLPESVWTRALDDLAPM